MLRRVKIVLIVYLWVLEGMAQEHFVSPVVPDFTDIQAACVVATAGGKDNPFEEIGIKAGRHEVIRQSGTDPHTNGQLAYLPEGVEKVVRLGNDTPGGAESLTYHFRVDARRPLLRVRLASLHNNWIDRRSGFSIRVLDNAGNKIEDCLEFHFSSDRNNPFPLKHYGRFFSWYDWDNYVILDMSRCAGQAVQVQFVTYDGMGQSSWSYIYFTAECISAALQWRDCDAKGFTLAMPEGFRAFDGYHWWNGREERESYFDKISDKLKLSGWAVAANGCITHFNADITPGENGHKGEQVYDDTILQGEGYRKHGFDLLPIENYGDYIFHQIFGNDEECRTEGEYTLCLKVKQRYYPIEVQLCEGEDYIANGFFYRQPRAGIYRDTLFFKNTIGADSIVVLKLSVATSFALSGGVEGNSQPCLGTVEVYRAPYGAGGYESYWEVPSGAEIVSATRGEEVSIRFYSLSAPEEIVYHGRNGCGEGRLSLQVEVHPTYSEGFLDTVCLGMEYHNYDFHLPKTENVGNKVYYQFYKTQVGCDSIRTLALTVLPSVAVDILASDSVVCSGEEVQLKAIATKRGEEETPQKQVVIGDIYCTDGSILSPKEYERSGKIAEGVVFWVDESGQHGWIVHKEVQSIGRAWVAYEGVSIPSPLYPSKEQALQDTAGYANTKAIWELGRPEDYPFLRDLDFTAGWYVPALRQLIYLRKSFFWINESLRCIGGTEFLLERNFERTMLILAGSTFQDNTLFYGYNIMYSGTLGEEGSMLSFNAAKEIHGNLGRVTLRVIRSF